MSFRSRRVSLIIVAQQETPLSRRGLLGPLVLWTSVKPLCLSMTISTSMAFTSSFLSPFLVSFYVSRPAEA
jgi:hypothetical protein